MSALRPRQVWGTGVLVASLGLLGIVVVAAEGRPLEGPTTSGRLDLGEGWRDVLLVLFGVALLAGAALVLWALAAPRHATSVRPRPRRHRWLLMVIVLLGVFVVATVIRPSLDDERDATTGSGTSAGDEGQDADQAPPWAVLALGGVVVIALAAAFVAGRRLRPLGDGDPDDTRVALLDALDASIDDLERDGDPRSGVIAAYARLLEGFERSGLGRTSSETPLEHLRRGLAALPLSPGPAERLTQLFLEARFSPHPIGVAEREEAHAALVSARRDLTTAAATAAEPR